MRVVEWRGSSEYAKKNRTVKINEVCRLHLIKVKICCGHGQELICKSAGCHFRSVCERNECLLLKLEHAGILGNSALLGGSFARNRSFAKSRSCEDWPRTTRGPPHSRQLPPLRATEKSRGEDGFGPLVLFGSRHLRDFRLLSDHL
jgi:hypothetical protein